MTSCSDRSAAADATADEDRTLHLLRMVVSGADTGYPSPTVGLRARQIWPGTLVTYSVVWDAPRGALTPAHGRIASSGERRARND